MNEIKNDSANKGPEKKGYYAVVKANGDLIVREGDASKHVPLKFMQDVVGGYIERVRNGNCPLDYWVDEEGAIKEKPINYVASAMTYVDNDFRIRQTIFGDMLILAHDGENTRFLTKDECEMVKKHYLKMAVACAMYVIVKKNGK